MITQSFLSDWRTCKRCPLSDHARRHVIGLGSLPADVVFIGEAPGPDEDVRGRPFVGRAGRLLKRILLLVSNPHLSPEELNVPISWEDVFLAIHYSAYITNIVACTPWTDSTRSIWREPNAAEAAACSPRLREIVSEACPKTIIYIGQVSKRFYKAPSSIPTLTITHPSAILRLGVPPASTVAYHQVIHRVREHLTITLNRKSDDQKIPSKRMANPGRKRSDRKSVV